MYACLNVLCESSVCGLLSNPAQTSDNPIIQILLYLHFVEKHIQSSKCRSCSPLMAISQALCSLAFVVLLLCRMRGEWGVEPDAMSYGITMNAYAKVRMPVPQSHRESLRGSLSAVTGLAQSAHSPCMSPRCSSSMHVQLCAYAAE